MKNLSYLTLLVFLSVHTWVVAQSKILTTLPLGIYYNEGEPDIKTSLNSDTHKLLFEAFKTAEIEDILGMKGPFTVFAPTNSAFEQFSLDQLSNLYKEENRKKLKELLTYHIVAGKLTAAKILKSLCRGKGQASFTTVQGTKIHAFMCGLDIVLTDSFGNEAKITIADATQRNGVIHQIDGVIQPSKL